MRRTWVYNPHTGGRRIPPGVRDRIRNRIVAHAEELYGGRCARIEVRFRGALCYIDAYREPDVPRRFNPKLYGESRREHIERLRNTQIHLCRLRYFGDEDICSMAFFTHSREKYEPCFFSTGEEHGTPEEAFDSAATCLA